jgi:hypothetical protein
MCYVFAAGSQPYWSGETTYAKQNGGAFDFIMNNRSNELHIGVPAEQEFWDFLMETSKRWGLTVYEQVMCGSVRIMQISNVAGPAAIVSVCVLCGCCAGLA